MNDETIVEICANHCGASCCSGDIFVGEVDADRLRAAGHKGFRTQSSVMVTDEEDRCRFLDKENRCTVYEDRPIDCRLFPFGFRVVAERLEIVLADCPLSDQMASEWIRDSTDRVIEMIECYSEADIRAYDDIPFSADVLVVETVPLSTVFDSSN